MKIAASFIEYLVIGCTASIWLGPMLLTWLSSLNDLTAVGVIALPIAYALGMQLDVLAQIVLGPVLRRTKRKRSASADLDGLRGYHKTVILARGPSELAQEVNIRSTRDRIARGVLINTMIAFFIYMISPPEIFGSNRGFVALAFVPSILFVGYTWWKFEEATEVLRNHAVNSLLESDSYSEGRKRPKKLKSKDGIRHAL